MNIIPTTTGAAKAITHVIPDLAGKLDGTSLRVPVITGSVVDLVVELNSDTTVEGINKALESGTNESLGFTMDPIVSSDIIDTHFGSMVDGLLTQAIEKDGAKLYRIVS
jgi:glyceraldehyde 3-phosphate dehydrogenase